jgi:hypothetical protein
LHQGWVVLKAKELKLCQRHARVQGDPFSQIRQWILLGLLAGRLLVTFVPCLFLFLGHAGAMLLMVFAFHGLREWIWRRQCLLSTYRHKAACNKYGSGYDSEEGTRHG